MKHATKPRRPWLWPVAAVLAGAGVMFSAGYAVGTHAGEVSRPVASATRHATALAHAPRQPTAAPVTRTHAPPTAAHVTAPRPVWDGRGRYPDNGVQPLCPVVMLHKVATVALGSAHAFVARCDAAGTMAVWDYAASAAVWHAWHVNHERHLAHVRALVERLE